MCIINVFIYCMYIYEGRDSSVDTATLYRLDGARIESQ
jgi:hypothetical protein